MSLKAYKNAQTATEDPRVTEYRLFGQVTGALLDAQKNGVSGTPLVEAIDWNRRMWRTLALAEPADQHRVDPATHHPP